MNKTILTLFLSLTILSACKKKQDPFLISKQHIGLLTDSSQVKDLESIYINDSIVKRIGGDEFLGQISDIEIYDKAGNLMLLLTPSQALDSTATIETVKIIDHRYKTEKGVHSASTFGDIKNNYTISSIQNTFKNVVVFVDGINAFFTIDKSELPSELEYNSKVKIEAIQIPDAAKIKYFMIGW